KVVYSSTMNISALEYRKINDLDDTDEQMALLVQRVSSKSFIFLYSKAEMFIVLEYTTFTASSKAAKRSSRLPLFTQNTDSYFPANAFPYPSSRKLLDLTIIGF
ncbi:MAG: hypothetical protein J6P91_01715, partial [Methanobrevibacter sp.]|nr:hypothetical protein [Methanobrevibacter sp.]